MQNERENQAYTKGYQVGYQHGLEAGRKEAGGSGGNYPVDVTVVYPERSSRLLMFFLLFKPLLLLPHVIVMYVLSLVAGVVLIIAWFAVVILGRYPKGMWDFMVGFTRWQTRVNAWMLGLTDRYPPFSLT